MHLYPTRALVPLFYFGVFFFKIALYYLILVAFSQKMHFDVGTTNRSNICSITEILSETEMNALKPIFHQLVI